MIPLLNNSLKNLRGERWKDVPGFEGSYQLSSYGRTKSLNRTMVLSDLNIRHQPTRILRPHVIYYSSGQKKNKKVKGLQIEFQKEAGRYSISLARYVYWLFVQPFDLKDHSLLIRQIDGDNLNIHYTNLELMTSSKYAKEGYRKGKRRSPFQLHIKPVSRYGQDGRLIASYVSARDAAGQLGVPKQYIYNAAASKTRRTAGSYWRYGKPKASILTGR